MKETQEQSDDFIIKNGDCIEHCNECYYKKGVHCLLVIKLTTNENKIITMEDIYNYIIDKRKIHILQEILK